MECEWAAEVKEQLIRRSTKHTTCLPSLARRLLVSLALIVSGFCLISFPTETVMPLIPVVRSRLTEEENHDFHDDLSDILVKHCARGSLEFLVGADLCAVQGTKLSDRSIS